MEIERRIERKDRKNLEVLQLKNLRACVYYRHLKCLKLLRRVKKDRRSCLHNYLLRSKNLSFAVFLIKTVQVQKMAGTEAAAAAEADCICTCRVRAYRKAKKGQNITNSSSPAPRPLSSPLSGTALGLSKLQLPPRIPGLSSPIHVESSDSDSDFRRR